MRRPVWPMRRRVKTVSTRREGWYEDGHERGEFFNWAHLLFVIRLFMPMGRPFSFNEGAYRGRHVGFWEKGWEKDSRVKGGCLGSDIDSVIAWDALMTRDPNKGDFVVAFLECGYKRVDTCRERMRGVKVGNVWY